MSYGMHRRNIILSGGTMKIRQSYAWILAKIWKYSAKSMLGEILCIIFISTAQPLLVFILQYIIDAISRSALMEGCILATVYVLGLGSGKTI